MRPPNEPVESTQTPATPVRPPRRTLIGWVIVLPLLLFLGLLAQPGHLLRLVTPPEAAAPTPAAEAGGVGTEATPVGAPATHEQSAKPNAADLESYTIYVPGPDALLHRKIVRERPNPTERAAPTDGVKDAHDVQHMDHALALLFKDSDSLFPPGTKVPHVKAKGDVVTVDLDKSLPNANLWHSEKITQLAVYSIVHTLNDGSTPVKVQLLAGGKPLDVLGEMDVSQPLEPNPQLVAQS